MSKFRKAALACAAVLAVGLVAAPVASAAGPPVYSGTYAGGNKIYTIYGATSPATSYGEGSLCGCWVWAINSGPQGTVDARRYELVFQTDCNLVERVYDISGTGKRFLAVNWDSGSWGHYDCGLYWQTDDNIVIRVKATGQAVWATNTVHTSGGAAFSLQDNGFMLVQYCCWTTGWSRPL